MTKWRVGDARFIYRKLCVRAGWRVPSVSQLVNAASSKKAVAEQVIRKATATAALIPSWHSILKLNIKVNVL